jgi:hypothetical protein
MWWVHDFVHKIGYDRDWIHKSNKHNKVAEGESDVLLFESMAHSRELKSSLKNKNQGLDRGERRRGAQDLDLNGVFAFLNGLQP